MGQLITYEVGRLNIGRRVKVKEGPANRRGGRGTLAAADPEFATIKPDGHGKNERAEWDRVMDWTSHNQFALVMPPPRATPIVLNGHKPAFEPTPVPMADVGGTLPTTDPFAVYADLGGALRTAADEVNAAEDLLDEALDRVHECRRVHDAAVEKLGKLRSRAAGALTAIDTMLAGTTAAVRPGEKA